MHEDILEELRTRWAVELAPDGFVELAGPVEDLPEASHRDDRVLAWACLARAPAALAALEHQALGPAGVHARASGLPAALVDDALQSARVRLLFGDDGRPPGLRAYRGRGSLAGFVRTVVVRIAIDLTRRDRETPDDHVEAVLADTHPDPELEYMRQQYAHVLREALRAAWRELQPHDRFVLGLQLHEKLDLDAIAKLYQVHRATAARRAATARAALISRTRDRIRAQLSVGDTTVDSILRIVTTSVAWSALAER
jgi:RNA polymerase sigma-70 factor (ECF subfamily)